MAIAQATATATIEDDDAATLSIADATIIEGSDGTSQLVFDVTLTGAVDSAIALDFTTTDGSAMSSGAGETDYTAQTGTLDFAGTDGEVQHITIDIHPDHWVEADEDFTVTLSNLQANGREVSIVNAIATGIITNDDTTRLSVDDITVPEGADRTTAGTVTVTLSNPSDFPVTVDVATADDTATLEDNDYVALSPTTLTFNPGETHQTVDLEIIGDPLFETDETILFTLTNAVNGELANSSATVTITNDDTLDSPIAPDIQDIEDTGISNSDRLTTLSQPTLFGTAEPNGLLELFDNGIFLGTTAVDSDGQWRFTPTAPLSDGDHAITVTVTAIGVTTAPSSATTITVDTIVPTGAIADLTTPIRTTAVDTVQVTFDEAVANFAPTDLQLTRNQVALDLSGVTTTTTDQKNWTINGLAPLSIDDGTYELSVINQDITDWAGNSLTTVSSTTWVTGQTTSGRNEIEFTGGRKGVTIKGDKERNILIGTPHNDVIRGGKGNDRILAGFGSDLFGRDRLYGDAGNDVLKSGKGNDYLDGGKGNDKLIGGKNHDELIGGKGNDKLIGGSGNDILNGGLGRDRLKGGKGRDTIVFNALNEGVDIVIGFNTNQDLIDLSGIFSANQYGADNSVAQFVHYVQLKQVGSATHISVDADGSGDGSDFTTLAKLNGVQSNNLSSRNFVMS